MQIYVNTIHWTVFQILFYFQDIYNFIVAPPVFKCAKSILCREIYFEQPIQVYKFTRRSLNVCEMTPPPLPSLTVNSPVWGSKPTWMVCSKFEGGEMTGLSLGLYTLPPANTPQQFEKVLNANFILIFFNLFNFTNEIDIKVSAHALCRDMSTCHLDG